MFAWALATEKHRGKERERERAKKGERERDRAEENRSSPANLSIYNHCISAFTEHKNG